jgi:hypothetical protein
MPPSELAEDLVVDDEIARKAMFVRADFPLEETCPGDCGRDQHQCPGSCRDRGPRRGVIPHVCFVEG